MSTALEKQPPEDNSNFLMDIMLNGKPFDRSIKNVHAGDIFEISISESDFQTYGGFYIFETSNDSYEEDYKTIFIHDGEQTDLGILPSVTLSEGKKTKITLKENTLYDIFYPHGKVISPIRVTTGKDPIPQSLTFDESKFLLAVTVDKKPADLAGISATLIADQEYLYNRHQYRYYGFQIGDLVATLSQSNIWVLIFTDIRDKEQIFARSVSDEEFIQNLKQIKPDNF